MALYSKFGGSELIRSGLNKALFRVRRFSKKEEQEEEGEQQQQQK